MPLTDYSFLTIGKREMELGLASFHNFSNRISPKERTLGELERLERYGPGLIQLDWIILQYISVGGFLWSPEAKKWKDINIGKQIEIETSSIYSGIYFYYEKLRNFSIGFNISKQTDIFRIYIEGIFKSRSEQYFSEMLKLGKKKRNQLSASFGLAHEGKYHWALVDYAFRSEGFTGIETDSIKSFVKRDSKAILGYNKDYFARDYIGISVGTSQFIFVNLRASLSNLISVNTSGGELSGGLSYLHKGRVVFGVSFVYYYGKGNSEYIS